MRMLPGAWPGQTAGTGRIPMEQSLFMLCMFFGVASVALIALTLLAIVLGKIQV